LGKFKKFNKNRFDDLAERFTANRLLDTNNASEVDFAVYGCYPLHPISTFILSRLSEKVAQNERTLFTFLSSGDRHTFSAFLAKSDDSFSRLLKLARVRGAIRLARKKRRRNCGRLFKKS
jgi:hypothetical protein